MKINSMIRRRVANSARSELLSAAPDPNPADALESYLENRAFLVPRGEIVSFDYLREGKRS